MEANSIVEPSDAAQRRPQTFIADSAEKEVDTYHTPPRLPPGTAEQISSSPARRIINDVPPMNDTPVELDFTPATSVRRQVKHRQLIGEDRMQKQYGKQGQFQIFQPR